MPRTKRDPKTKEDILNRMLSYDFDGDIRHLGAEQASLVRVSANSLRLTFPASGTVFDLTVHRPREFAQKRVAATPAVQPQDQPERQPEQRSFKQDGDERARIDPVGGQNEGGKRTVVRRRRGETDEQVNARRQEAHG